MKTFLFLLASFFVMMVMGTVYTWSVFRVEVESVYQASALQSGLPYMASLFFYAIAMMVTGRVLNMGNTRKIAAVGALLIAVGWLLAAQSSSLLALTLSYGVLIGVGVGMVYGIPVFLVNRRYEKSGLYAGIILSGFGASPLVTAPLVHRLIVAHGLMQTFLFMGAVSLVVLIPLCLLFKGKAAGVNPLDQAVAKAATPGIFPLLYAIFLIGTTIGLMMIGLSYRIGVVNYGFDVRRVALSLSFFAVLNGIARPLFGLLVDKKGFLFASGLNGLLSVMAALLALVNNGQILLVYGLSMGLFWFSLGGWLAMLPASIKLYFGTGDYAKRYGLMFTAYGFGAMLGTVLSGVVLDVFVGTAVLYALVIGLLGMVFILRSHLRKRLKTA
ncbi:MAG: MFS transporter [Acholeplasmatales bacterium]|nr:MAG: MFS transporter [Acholeplasmatales bacterium]